jgi:hypothetical protein
LQQGLREQCVTPIPLGMNTSLRYFPQLDPLGTVISDGRYVAARREGP